jgi:protein SCO1/2
MNKIWLFGTGVVIGLALVLMAGWVLLNKNYTYNGVVIDPPAPAADFTLTDQNGQPFTLSEQRGKLVLIFFGYTNCPDVCPITLSEFKRVKDGLQEQADRVEFVYITVDPERDTVERMAQYLPNFDPQFVGLSGDEVEMQPVWEAYGVYREKQDLGSAAGYLVDHSTRTYLIDADGNWRINFPYGTDPELIVADLLHVLKE